MSTKSSILLGQPGHPPSIGHLVRVFFEVNKVTKAQFIFAYVSLAGLKACIEDSSGSASFQQAQKHWLVGLHHGITEPSALRALLDMKATNVRVFSPTGKIELAALMEGEKLHAKAIRLISADRGVIIVGSANLTRSALSSDCVNYEAGVSLAFDDHGKGVGRYGDFTKWFSTAWNNALPLDEPTVKKYAEVRERLLDKHPHVAADFDEHPIENMSSAGHLWIEAGAMSGGDRNQIEFGPRLAAYFGPLQGGVRQLRIEYGGVTRADRPLSYKVTKWGTQIWRLGLLTSTQGGPSYPGNIVRITRKHNAIGEYWELQVAPPGSRPARRWRRLSNLSGTVSTTGLGFGGRTYGIY